MRKQAYLLTGRTMNVPLPDRRVIRRLGYGARYLQALLWTIVVSPQMLWRRDERTILWGKIRRSIIASVPGLALHLKRKYRLTGGCSSCGTSCNLLLRCPHWDDATRLCSIYEDRPITCRLFPITPADIRDRNLASSATACGYSFVPMDPPQDWSTSRTRCTSTLAVRSAARTLSRLQPSTLDEAKQNHHDRDDQQDMNESAHRV